MTRPVRHVHLGLGNFFRAHQAWYSQHAPDGDEWGIAAFSGHSTSTAEQLTRQGGYTLLTRGPDGDTAEWLTPISEAHPGTDHARLLTVLADPAVAVVTLTITEAGYRADDADAALLREDLRSPVGSAPARLVAGLAARRAAGGGPLAVVPCDNLPANGTVARDVVLGLADRVDPALAGWIGETVSFVSTVVDRITPRTTDADLARAAELTGRVDAVPVATEPFSEWMLAGDFPAGRPAWAAGFTDDVTEFEHRKLRLLNGAHSLLAYAGPPRGHTTVAGAITDPVCRDWVEQWWDEAAATVDLPAGELDNYRAALLTRFANPRIRHELAQIAIDGSQKLPVRVAPVLLASLAAGADVHPGARIVAAWIRHLRAGGVRDVAAARAVAAADAGVTDVLGLLDPALADHAAVRAAVAEQLAELDRI